MNRGTHLERFPFNLTRECSMSFVSSKLDGSSWVRRLERNNMRMERQLGRLILIQRRMVSRNMWIRSGELAPVRLHQSCSEAPVDESSDMIQLGDRSTAIRVELTKQVEDETRVEMHVTTDATSCGPSIFAGSAPFRIRTSKHRDVVNDLDVCLVMILWEHVKLEAVRAGERKLRELSDKRELTELRSVVILFHEEVGVRGHCTS